MHSEVNVPFTSEINQYLRKFSCMRTKWESKAWPQVDLLQNALIHSTRIYSRRDFCQERLRDALILVPNDETFLLTPYAQNFHQSLP